jgi:uncharacterized protein (DUF924 family)
MHQESLLAQVAIKSLLEQSGSTMALDDPHRKAFESSVKSAQHHQDVIEEFGRYPSRNDILGRVSTAEELKHLEANPHGFSKPAMDAEKDVD